MPDESVYAYFLARVGRNPCDESLRDLPVTSECGADCKRVIDAGVAFRDTVDTFFKPLVASVIEDAVAILWRG